MNEEKCASLDCTVRCAVDGESGVTVNAWLAPWFTGKRLEYSRLMAAISGMRAPMIPASSSVNWMVRPDGSPA